MLFETLEYYENINRCPSYLKSYKQIEELIAIKHRHQRCFTHWKAHLDNTKKFINENIDRDPNIFGSSYVLVLGAGLGNDLDLYFLTDNFERVILVDLFFLKSARKKLSFYPNIFFSEFDVTQCMEEILLLLQRYKNDKIAFLERLQEFTEQRSNSVNNFKEHPFIKLINNSEIKNIISLNLLSQLSLSFAQLFEQTFKGNYDEKEFYFFYKMLIKEHLQLMTYAKKQGKSVLIISDTSKYISDRRGKEMSQESTLYEVSIRQNLPNIKQQKNWYWELAPLGEISSNYSLRLLVSGIKI
jgi:hypothetical protein